MYGWMSTHKCVAQPLSDVDVIAASLVFTKLISNYPGLNWSQFQLALYTINTNFMLITHAHGGKCYYSLVHGIPSQTLQ